jgi:hypothetical protein
VTSEANDAPRSHELELIIDELGQEQSAIARSLGFKACALSFTDSLGGA